MKRIYYVEDEKEIRDLVCYTLNASGFEAQGFVTARDFWSALKKQPADLIILDIMLPEEDGMHILKKLRSHAQFKNIPVIICSAKSAEFDKVFALDSGADDYLVKPFGMMEMVSHIKAVLRRYENINNPDDGKLIFKDIVIDKKKHAVFVHDEPIDLTIKEFELLCFLVENPGFVFTREKLLEKVWGINFMGETRTCDVHIGTLRTKLKDSGSLIKTVRGIGYKIDI